jgi:hypothetical protein
MRNTWLDSKLLADKIATRYKELLVEAVRRELQFVSLLEDIDKEQEKNETDDTTIHQDSKLPFEC